MALRLPDGHPMTKACADDKAYFDDRPAETARVRDVVPGEFEPGIPGGDEDFDAVFVTVVGPGVRARQPFRRVPFAPGSELPS